MPPKSNKRRSMSITTSVVGNTTPRQPSDDDTNGADFTRHEIIKVLAGIPLEQKLRLRGSNFKKLDLSKLSFQNSYMELCCFEETNCQLTDFTNANLKNSIFFKTILQGAVLARTDLSHCHFQNIQFEKCDLRNTNFSESTFEKCTISSLRFVDCQFENSRFHSDIHFFKCNFESCSFEKSIFKETSVISESCFSKCNFSYATFFKASQISKSIFQNCCLDFVDLSQPKLFFVDFSGSQLNKALYKIEMLREQSCSIKGCEFVELDWSHCDLSSFDISNCQFVQCNLSGVKLQGSKLIATKFLKCDLREAQLQDCSMNELTSFEYSDLRNSAYQLQSFINANVNLQNVNWSGEIWDNISCKTSKDTYLHLKDANLTNLSCNQSNVLAYADLRGVNLSYASLQETDLRFANFVDAKYVPQQFRFAKSLFKTNFSNANWSNSDLKQMNLSGAILTNAKLQNCELANVNFDSCNLDGADLRFSRYREDDLSKAASLISARVNGESLISTAYGASVAELLLWDIKKNTNQAIASHLNLSKVTCMEFKSNQGYAGTEDGRVLHMDANTGQVDFVNWIQGYGAINVLKFDRQLLCCNRREKIEVYQLDKSQPAYSFKAHEKMVQCMVLLHGSNHLVSGSYDSTIRMFDLEARKQVMQFVGHKSSVKVMHLDQFNERVLITAGSDKEIFLWDVRANSNDKPSQTIPINESFGVNCLERFENQLFWTSVNDCTLRVIDLRINSEQDSMIYGAQKEVKSAENSDSEEDEEPVGRKVNSSTSSSNASSSANLNNASMPRIPTLKLPPPEVKNRNNPIRKSSSLVLPSSRSPHSSLSHHGSGVESSIMMMKQNQALNQSMNLTSSRDKHKTFSETLKQEVDNMFSRSYVVIDEKKSSHAHSMPISCMASLGSKLFTGSEDSSIKQWDISSLSVVKTFNGHKGYIKSMVVI